MCVKIVGVLNVFAKEKNVNNAQKVRKQGITFKKKTSTIWQINIKNITQIFHRRLQAINK